MMTTRGPDRFWDQVEAVTSVEESMPWMISDGAASQLIVDVAGKKYAALGCAGTNQDPMHVLVAMSAVALEGKVLPDSQTWSIIALDSRPSGHIL